MRSRAARSTYDLGEELTSVEGESDAGHRRVADFVEIWNLVFMQFDQNGGAWADTTRLPAPSIDTGMGLERIAAVLQGKVAATTTPISSLPLMEAMANRERGPSCGQRPETSDFSLRVIADHARALCFLVADGVIPACEQSARLRAPANPTPGHPPRPEAGHRAIRSSTRSPRWCWT